MQNKTKKLQQTILNWYEQNGRDLPWRKTRDPYKIMVSEVMLQQTQASRVIPKYESWLKEFPTVKALAEASTGDVLQAWSGLGYNRRALYLQRNARQIVKELSNWGRVPKTVEDLLSLPGIGSYTATAICSFAWNQDVALVDTNIKRFYELIIFGDGKEPTDKELKRVAEEYLPKGESRQWHNALMDIGARVAQEKGAKAQQEKLVALFPLLKKFDLPTVSSKRLKRPKQSDFRSSRRYWRGKIIQLLLRHKRMSLKRLLYYMNEYEDKPCPYNFEELISELSKDNLVEIRKESVLLPTT